MTYTQLHPYAYILYSSNDDNDDDDARFDHLFLLSYGEFIAYTEQHICLN